MFLSWKNSAVVIIRREIRNSDRKSWDRLRWINVSLRGSKEESIFRKLPPSYFPEFLETRFENALHLYFVLLTDRRAISLQHPVRTRKQYPLRTETFSLNSLKCRNDSPSTTTWLKLSHTSLYFFNMTKKSFKSFQGSSYIVIQTVWMALSILLFRFRAVIRCKDDSCNKSSSWRCAKQL